MQAVPNSPLGQNIYNDHAKNVVAFVIIQYRSERYEDNFSSLPVRYLWVNDYKGISEREHYIVYSSTACTA